MMQKSNLLQKTKSMLKQLKASNDDLNAKINTMGAQSVSIEHFDASKDSKTPHIDLDLYLGILEEKNEKRQQQNVKSTTDKLLGVKSGKNEQKKSIIIKGDDDSDTDIDEDEDSDMIL